jgi:hybrid cluster-associated redox disulfide protein
LRWRNDSGREPREDGPVARTEVRVPTLQTTVAELLAGWSAARQVLGRRGMACVGCTMARFETIAEAAAAYGLDAHGLIDEVTRAAHVRPERHQPDYTAARRPGRSRTPHGDRPRRR